MNVVERAAARPPQAAVEPPEGPPAAAPPSPRKAKLRPLLSLLPYIWCYRLRAAAAACALLVAALATFAVPLAVRRLIDFRFTSEGANLIHNSLPAMLGVV